MVLVILAMAVWDKLSTVLSCFLPQVLWGFLGFWWVLPLRWHLCGMGFPTQLLGIFRTEQKISFLAGDFFICLLHHFCLPFVIFCFGHAQLKKVLIWRLHGLWGFSYCKKHSTHFLQLHILRFALTLHLTIMTKQKCKVLSLCFTSWTWLCQAFWCISLCRL